MQIDLPSFFFLGGGYSVHGMLICKLHFSHNRIVLYWNQQKFYN